MNNCYRLFISALVGSCLLVLAILPLAAQDKPGNPAYDWLNGKWSGPAPLGGELQLELRVVDDDKVVGHSKIPIAGSKRAPAGTVSGTVKGDQG